MYYLMSSFVAIVKDYNSKVCKWNPTTKLVKADHGLSNSDATKVGSDFTKTNVFSPEQC